MALSTKFRAIAMKLILLYFQRAYLRHIVRRTEKASACQKAVNAELRRLLAELQQD
jgi:hypothetical protein